MRERRKGGLTGRDHVHKESPRLQRLGKPVHSSLHNWHERVVLLLDRIPISDHQNDSPSRPKRSEMSDHVGCIQGKTNDKRRPKSNRRNATRHVLVRAEEKPLNSCQLGRKSAVAEDDPGSALLIDSRNNGQPEKGKRPIQK